MPNFEVIFKHTYSDACVFCYFRGGKTVFYSADKILLGSAHGRMHGTDFVRMKIMVLNMFFRIKEE